MKTTKVILLNGFAGSGKSTIARKYVDAHPLSMVIESDELIVNIGGWLAHEDQAWPLVFSLTKSMISTALALGHDIILPYLVRDADRAAEIEEIARTSGATFYEFYLSVPKDRAIQKLLDRGIWGEPGAPPITNDDIPLINEIYDLMDGQLQKRPKQIHIEIEEGSPEATYQKILDYIASPTR